MLVKLEKFGKEERAVCTSMDVAETFGKAHDKVMRDIRELGCSPEFNAANFGDIYYTDSMNRKQKAYVMTRDGFTKMWRKAPAFRHGDISRPCSPTFSCIRCLLVV